MLLLKLYSGLLVSPNCALGCKGAVVDTGRANSHPGCKNELRKRYSHFVGGLFLAEKAGCVMKECLPAENTDYYMFVNE